MNSSLCVFPYISQQDQQESLAVRLTADLTRSLSVCILSESVISAFYFLQNYKPLFHSVPPLISVKQTIISVDSPDIIATMRTALAITMPVRYFKINIRVFGLKLQTGMIFGIYFNSLRFQTPKAVSSNQIHLMSICIVL
jgi:hypothetical protein